MSDDTTPNDGFDPDDSIMAAWTSQSHADDTSAVSLDPNALAESVAADHRRDQRTLLWVNLREIAPSIVLAGIFASLVSDSTHPAALAIASILALSLACFLVGSSIRHHRADRQWGTSIRDQLARRLAQLSHRTWMYRNLAWWYFLPLTSSVLLAIYGLGGKVGGSFETLFVLAYGVYVAVAYPRARKHGRDRYESEVERLESVLAEFDQTA